MSCMFFALDRWSGKQTASPLWKSSINKSKGKDRLGHGRTLTTYVKVMEFYIRAAVRVVCGNWHALRSFPV